MPYVAPTPRPTTAPAAANSPELPTSTVTPTFDKAVFEPAKKTLLFSPSSKTAPTTPTSAPDLADIIARSSNTRVATPRESEGDGEPQQSAWMKRKPVPGNIVLPEQGVPTSHPFARSTTSIRASPRDEIPTTPISPRHGGPLPPRRPGAHSRNVSLNRFESPTSPAESDLADRPGLFWRPPVSEPAKEGDEMEVLRCDNGDGEDDDPAQSKADDTGKVSANTTDAPHPEPATASRTSSPKDGVAMHDKSDDSHPEPTTPPPQTSSSGHPLRLRIDKSLPALPLDAGRDSSDRPSRSRHVQMDSTSSGPSTRIITPRSASQPFGPRSTGKDGSEEEGGHRSYWPKRLGVLNRAKKDKSSEKQPLDGSEEKVPEAHGRPEVSRRVSLLPLGEPEEDETFSVDRIPSKRRLWEAGTLFVRDEEGELVCFGDMFPKMPAPVEQGQPIPPIPKTAVFFIRHFWCGQCQDFMFASLSQLDPEALEQAGIRVVIISNGSWKIIKSYRKLFKCPFPIYVDGPRKLYQLMGMTKMTNDFGPLFKGRAAYHQRNVPRQLLHGGKNALTKMPLAYPGKLTQLGGEFVFSPGYNCDFAHRMTNTSNHMEAPDVLRLAGCPHPTKSEVQEITIEENQRAEFDRLEKEMRDWRSQRETELERIRRRRAERRGEQYKPMASTSLMALGLDREEEEQARAAVPLPAESPNSDGSGIPSPSPTGGDEEDSRPKSNGDGPVCLPIDTLEDVLAWEPDAKVENGEDSREMDEKFAAFMRAEGLDVGLGNGLPDAVGNTFGRKSSATGTGNGLEVVVEDRH